MRTSLLETEQIDEHLMRLSEPGDALVFEARLLLDPELKEKLHWQQKTYTIIKQYGRQQLKQEIDAAHRQLFSKREHTGFRQKVMRLFAKK